MVLGYFGRTPVPPDPEIMALASKQLGLEPTTRDPREINDEDPTKGLAPARARLEEEGLPITDENVFIVATCKDKGIKFLKGEGDIGVRKKKKEAAATPAKPASNKLSVTVNGKRYDVDVDDGKAVINGRTYQFDVREADPGAPAAGSSEGMPVPAPISGKVMSIAVSVGDRVAKDALVLKMEAMKMEFDVVAPADGVVTEIKAVPGAQVQDGDVLLTLGS
jgi:pyruvate carboxylase subunit B